MTDRLVQLANRYGPLGAVALFLVWWMANDVAGSLRKIDSELTEHVSETNSLLKAICINVAESEAERANCLYR